MRKLIVLASVLALGFTAAPAFASVQNVKISGSIDSTYILRENFEFNDLSASGGKEEQSVFITQTILQIDADLTDNVAATIALINERPWEGNPGSTASGVDLLRAYVTLREMLYSPMTVVVGRQWFAFGNSFIFDAAGTNNSAPGDSGIASVAADLTLQTNLDAIRVILDYNPLTITAFYGAVTPKSSGTLSDTDDSVNVWGLNAGYELGDDMNTLVEAYIFDKKDKSEDANTAPFNEVDHLKVVGTRFSTTPLEGINLQGEIAHQGGTRINSPSSNSKQTRDSWAFQALANYQVPVLKDYNPVVSFEWTKLYGDEGTTTDEDYKGWDPFFENQDGGTIYNTLFNFTNLEMYTVGFAFSPMEDVSTKLSATKLMLNQDNDGSTFSLVQPDGTNATVNTHAGQKELGTEIDGVITYDYTEDVRFGLNVGVFKPAGIFLANDSAKQVLANVRVAF